jgi:integrase
MDTGNIVNTPYGQKTPTDLMVLDGQDITLTSQTVKSDFTKKYWDKEYINDRIDKIDNTSHKMLIAFLWMSGVRITEAVSLQKKDIDFRNYVMVVKWLKSRKYLRRVVPLHPTLKDMLEIYTGPMKSEDVIFDISRQRAWQLTRKYLNGHPHQLRHSFAVNWLRCDGDLVTLHRILGHSKIQTTMEYLKICPVDQGKELIKITFR